LKFQRKMEKTITLAQHQINVTVDAQLLSPVTSQRNQRNAAWGDSDQTFDVLYQAPLWGVVWSAPRGRIINMGIWYNL